MRNAENLYNESYLFVEDVKFRQFFFLNSRSLRYVNLLNLIKRFKLLENEHLYLFK